MRHRVDLVEMRLLAVFAPLLALLVVPFHGETQVLTAALALVVAAAVFHARPA